MDRESRVIYHQTTKKNNNSQDDYSEFVGLRFEYEEKNGQIYVHYPRSLGRLPLDDTKENKKLLLNLVRSFKLLKNADYEDKKYDSVVENINVDRFPLFSYLWVWDDFKKYGRLIFHELINSRNDAGVINWKKTFQGNALVYGNNIYYTDYIYRKKKAKEELLTEIYDYCVYKSLEMIFFLTNLSQNIIHPLYKNISGKRNEYVNCLNDSIESTFDDEKKLRYKHMLNIVNAYSFDSLVNKNIVGVSSYAGVFEKEIDLLFGNVKDISQFYPEAFVCEDGGDPQPAGKLRQDTLNITDDECFIIDSKFYEFGNMPATESIEKQIVYGEYIELNKAFSNDKIYNVFLIPRSFKDEKWDEDILKYYGYAYSGWKENKKRYETVLIYFIDLKYVISNYRNGYSQELFSKLRADVLQRYNEMISE